MASRAAVNAKAKVNEQAKNGDLQEALQSALVDRQNAVDAGGLLGDIIEIWGGPRRLAVDIHREFQEAAVGGMTRQKILDNVLKLITYSTDRQITKAVKPSEMTDADLEVLAMSYMKKISGSWGNLPQGQLPDPESKDAVNGWQEAYSAKSR